MPNRTKEQLLKENERFKCELSILKGIIHDLKSPLHAQEGFCNFLLKQFEIIDISQEQKARLTEPMNIIKKISLESLTTMNDFTDLMAFEERRFKVDPNERTYLFTPVQAVINHYSQQIEQYGFNVINSIAQDIEVNVWEHHIKRIMYNIFGNSIKFNASLAKERKKESKEPVKIDIGVADIGEIIEWHIWDSGIGLEPEKTENIFEEFYKTDKKESGTGLGLYISRKIARAYGGDIIAEGSKEPENSYSDFIITLPKPKIY